MMGRSHAVSGGVGWTALCAAATAATEVRPSWSTVVVGAAVSAGCALLPDLDHPGSTISRSLGPITGVTSRLVSWAADVVQDVTCRCCKDPDSSGHRALTHTTAGCLSAGVVVGAVCWWFGLAAAAVVVGLAVALAVRGVVPGRWRGTFGSVTAGVLAAASVWSSAPVDGWWWLGVPVAFGTLAHSLGDGLTKSAVPLLWPVRIRGCRWYPLGSPRWLRFRTGSWVETWVVGGLMAAVFAGSAWVLAG